VPVLDVYGAVPVLLVYGAVPLLFVYGAVPVPTENDDVELAETIGETLGLEDELEEDATDDEDVDEGAPDRQSQAALISSALQVGPRLFGNGPGKRALKAQNSCGSGRTAVSVRAM